MSRHYQGRYQNGNGNRNQVVQWRPLVLLHPRIHSTLKMEGKGFSLSVLILASICCFICGGFLLSHSISGLYVLGDSSVTYGTDRTGIEPRLVADFIAHKMGLPVILPFSGHSGGDQHVRHVINFGSTPATIINSGNMEFEPLNHQLRRVFDTMKIMQMRLGHDNATRLVRSSVFYVSFGSDDYTRLFRPHSSGVRSHHGGRDFTNIMVKTMAQVVKNLYKANARKIICMGIGPLGCAPRVLWETHNSTDETGCVEEVNELVVQYNTMLSARLLELNNQLFDAQITFCDVYQGMQEIIHHPNLYGFSNAREACCGSGLYGGMVGCQANDMVCRDPSVHVWWDFYSPTQGVNSLLADWTWNGKPHQLCRPMNIQQMVST